MKFEFIEDTLKPYGLKIAELEFLKIDSSPFSVMCFQICSDLEVGKDFLKNKDEEKVKALYQNFFDLIEKDSPSLALCPEYSCPISIIDEIVADKGKFPSIGHLWSLGTESITQEKLVLIKKKLKDKGIEVIAEEPKGNKKFLDPVFIFFTAEKKDKSHQKVIIIQFKTQHMGVWVDGSDFEKENLIEGEKVYILRNDVNSVHFITLLCSEIMSINTTSFETLIEKDWKHTPYIIAHLQLNPKAEHEQFVLFRKSLFNYTSKELITLNHAKGTKIQGKELINYSGSAIYVNPLEAKKEDKDINLSHKVGLYLNLLGKKRYKYLLNSGSFVFELQMDSPSHSGLVGPVSRKAGCSIKNLYSQEEKTLTKTTHLKEGFSKYVQGLGYECNFSEIENIINIERMLAISTANVSYTEGKPWFLVDNLPCFELTDNETSQRITIVEDPDKVANEIRKKTLQDYFELCGFVADWKNFEEADNFKIFKDKELKVDFLIYEDKKIYHKNIVEGNIGATASYIGLASEEEANKAFAKLKKITADGSRFLLILWYKNGGKLHSKFIPYKPLITSAISGVTNTITSTDGE